MSKQQETMRHNRQVGKAILQARLAQQQQQCHPKASGSCAAALATAHSRTGYRTWLHRLLRMAATHLLHTAEQHIVLERVRVAVRVRVKLLHPGSGGSWLEASRLGPTEAAARTPASPVQMALRVHCCPQPVRFDC